MLAMLLVAAVTSCFPSAMSASVVVSVLLAVGFTLFQLWWHKKHPEELTIEETRERKKREGIAVGVIAAVHIAVIVGVLIQI